jgi:hypothetical protein
MFSSTQRVILEIYDALSEAKKTGHQMRSFPAIRPVISAETAVKASIVADSKSQSK